MKKFLSMLLALSVVFTYTFGAAGSVFATASTSEPGDASKITYDQAVTEVQEAAKNLRDAEADVMASVLTGIFGTKSYATLDSVKVNKADIEKLYKEEVYNSKIDTINAEESTKLQAIQAAMNMTAVPTGDAVTVSSAFSASGYGTATTIKFAGFFVKGTDNAYTYDATLDTLYVYPAYDTTYSTSASSSTAYTAVFDKAASTPATSAPTGSKIDKAGKVAFTAAKDAAVAAIQAITLKGVYSEEYKGAAQSNYDLAKDAVTNALNGITTASNTATATNTWAAYKTGVLAINAIYTAPVNQQKATGTLMNALNAIPTIADEPTEAGKLSFAKTKVLDFVKDKIDTYYNGIIANADNSILTEQLKGSAADAEKIAKYKEIKEDALDAQANAVEVLTYLVNDKENYAQLITGFGHPFNAATATVNTWNFDTTGPTAGTLTFLDDTASTVTYSASQMYLIVEHVAELKADAELIKATIGIDGSTTVSIDKKLAEEIKKTYKNNDLTTAIGGMTANDAVVDRINELLGAGTFEINGRSYSGVASWPVTVGAGAGTAFELDQADEVRAAIKNAQYTIGSALSIADADAAYLAALESYKKIPTKADKSNAQAQKEFKDLLAEYNAGIAAYVDFKDASITGAGKSNDYNYTKLTWTRALQATFLDAYTVDELKAAYVAAKADVDALKTKEELKAAKAAIDARIAALPATITVADRETVIALNADIDAHNQYCTDIGSTITVTVTGAATNALTKVKSLDNDAIKSAYDKIMLDGKVTVDEKAAVEALRKAFDEYVANYTAEDAAALSVPTSVSAANVSTVEAALSTAEVDAVEVMIAKLPADGSNVEAVKAARAAYDALSLSQKVRVNKLSYGKLADVEKIIEAAVKAEEEAAKNEAEKEALKTTIAVKDSKAKFTASKAYKNSIKLTFNKPAVGVDGYVVYMATKKNGLYKKVATVKTNTYTKKSLKKGTAYYFKVKAYKVVDGKKVYTQTSGKLCKKTTK